jgi:hypothetical protein
MALHSIFDSGPERLSPEQAMRLEGIFLACRARDARRHRERPATETEYQAEIGGGREQELKAPRLRGFLVSPLPDSNRRPPPYHGALSGGSQGTGGC